MPVPRLLVAVLLLGSPLLVPAASAEADPVGAWPLQPEPRVVRGFDPPAVSWAAGHRGVDLLGRYGQAVGAALPGVVRFAGRLAGRGVVVVGHGDTRTTYEPVTPAVEVGDRVGRGGTLGHLDLAGSHCLPRACLHWGWRRDDTYLDPLALVGARPVRLLPLWRDEPVGLALTPASGAVAPPLGLIATWASWTPPTHPYALVLQRLARIAGSPPA